MKQSIIILCCMMGMCLVGCGQSSESGSKLTSETQSISDSVTDEVKTNGGIVVTADYPEYANAKKLVKNSDAVFSATVTNISYQDIIDEDDPSATLPYIYYEVEIDQIYKGEDLENPITIEQLNSQGAGQATSGQEIVEGEEYLFLVKTFENSYPNLVNESQSVFEMNLDDSVSEGSDNGSDNEESEPQISLEEVLEELSE